MGIVVKGSGTFVQLGNVSAPSTLLAIFCFIFIAVLLVYKFYGGILIGILITGIASMLLGVSKMPDQLISLPPSLSPIFLQLDISGALKWSFFSVILTIFMMDFVDTMGTIIGVSVRANLLDEDGNLPDIEKPMLADSLATIFGSLCGTTTTGTYVESASGIEAGAKSGFSSLIVAFLFIVSLIFWPFLTALPPHAYGPALVIVGLLMFNSVKHIDFSDYTEIIPSFVVIILMSFTFDIGIGMTAGFTLYPLIKLLAGRYREVNPGSWILGGMSLAFFVFYPA